MNEQPFDKKTVVQILNRILDGTGWSRALYTLFTNGLRL